MELPATLDIFTNDRPKFKFELTTKVYCMIDEKPVSGRIFRRGYQETWHDDLDDVGGYIANIFYEVNFWSKKQIFHESDFGRKIFTDPSEFANYITSQ